MPTAETIRQQKGLGILGHWLHDANLWHLNRRSASGAFAVGLFVAFIPVPFQMLLAAIGAILLRVNIAISVALVWVTNPITMPPIFYFTYKVGAWLLGSSPYRGPLEYTWEWASSQLTNVLFPFLVGSFVCGTLASMMGFMLVRLLWRLSIVKKSKLRKKKIS